jgi:hypothetical protein
MRSELLTAECTSTGMFTRPNVIAPFQMDRGIVRSVEVVRLCVEDRNDERASEVVQVTKHQRETRARRNNRATNNASTNDCGFRATCPLSRVPCSHARGGKLPGKCTNCDKNIREIGLQIRSFFVAQLVAF